MPSSSQSGDETGKCPVCGETYFRKETKLCIDLREGHFPLCIEPAIDEQEIVIYTMPNRSEFGAGVQNHRLCGSLR